MFTNQIGYLYSRNRLANNLIFGVNSFCHLLILVFASLNCFGQEAAFKNYNDQNGLPSSEVYQVFQDSKGFIWFATDNGVVRFDGGEFKLFNKSNGLADAVVFTIREDLRKKLWFKTFTEGASIYEKGAMTPYPFNHLIKSVGANRPEMAIDSLGQVYFSGAGTEIRFFRVTTAGVLEPLKIVQPPATDTQVIYFHEITKNNFLIGVRSIRRSLYSVYLNGKAYDIPFPKGETIYTYCKSWRDAIYLSIGNRLYKIENSKAKLVFTSQEPIISLSVDKENNFWAGSLSGGVVRFSDDTFLHPQEMPLLKSQSVTSVLQDSERGFWFSTLEKGVFYVPNSKILNNNLPEDSKMNFALANDESVFIGFYNGTILKIDKRTRKKTWSIDLQKPIVAGIFLEKDSLLWISTSNHSVFLNKQGVVVKEYHQDTYGGEKFVVKKFFKSPDRIWGINHFGALEFDLKGNLLSIHNLGFWCRNIFVNENDVYLAGVTGLRKTDKSFQKMTEIASFRNDKISGLTFLPDKKILVSTIGSGFKIMDGQKIKAYSKKEGLIFESIYATAVDSSLWLGTDKGLLKVDLRLLLNKEEFSYDLIDKASGLSSDKVNFISRNGNETWCGSNNSFSVFDDRKIHFANKTPVPRLNSITVNSQLADSAQLLDLSYLDNNIEFDFGFQSFNSRNLFLRHKSSSSRHWNYTRNFNIHYFSLAPGNYVFEVEYSTDQVHWKKITFPNKVVIKPVWWETIYFRIVILLVVGLIFFIYFRAKYKSRLLKLELADQLKSEKERIAQDLHDNIGSRLVSLSLGLNHVVKEYEIESSTAEQIYSNVNSTVTELRDTIWAIQKEGVTIEEFCDKLRNLIWRLKQNNGTTRYDLQVKTDDDYLVLKPTQAINLYRIIQEAIANSQKHSEADLLVINVYEDKHSHRFCIRIEDNGRGFDIGNPQMNEHYGLKNMRARAEEIKASFEISTQPGNGAMVMVSLPLSGNH